MNIAALDVVNAASTFLVRRIDRRGGIARFWVERPIEDLLAEESRTLSRLRREVKWPGYRRGSVPESLVRQRHGELIRETSLQSFLRDSVARALSSQQLVALAPPTIETVERQDGVLRFRMAVECPPDVDLAGYLGMELHRREFPVDEAQVDEACANLAHGEPGATATPQIRRAVRRLLEVESERRTRRDLERQVAEQLLRGHEVTLPPSPVASLAEDYLERLKVEFLRGGGALEDWPGRRRDVEGLARAEAEHRLKLTYLLAGVAQIEGIQVTEDDLDVALDRALASLSPAKRARALTELNERREALRPVLLEDKIYDFLLARARIVRDDASKVGA
jgi:FKBP-type peptidyl-prolyl cis-trans isomerase (trigger factor)